MPAGSKTDPPLAKAKPISTSVITYLRRKTKQLKELLQPERGVKEVAFTEERKPIWICGGGPEGRLSS
ncbi:zinc finger protein 462-like [Grus japonensis]|uniref:Zinc finger protein 462-like n=1 Tax=Grus japonensis TaxID=30415 RepID=A0ABC9X4Y0_GRUJA